MENLKTLLGIIVVIAIGWHVKVAFSSDTKLIGLFQEKPEYGYSWENINSNVGGLGCSYEIDGTSKYPCIKLLAAGGSAESIGLIPNDFIIKINGESTNNWTKGQIKNQLWGTIGSTANVTIWRNGVESTLSFTRARLSGIDDEIRLMNAYNPDAHYFWDKNEVKWCTGYAHPKFNVQTGETKNTWVASPGYVLTGTKEGDFGTLWKAGLSHPAMNAYSTSIEGRWIPELGYKFIMENGLASGTTWAAGTKYIDLKITAAEKEGYFNAFPGYTFPNPTKNLDVAWTPGLKDPNNSNKISGSTEGEWIDNTEYATATDQPIEPKTDTWGDHLATSAATAALANFAEWLFGKNFISNELNKKSDEELIKSAIKGYEKLTEKQ